MGIDSLSVSAHKIYGPKGVGACYINPQVRWTQIFPGLLTKRISSRYSERSWHRSFLTAAENILKINKKKVYVLKGYDLTFRANTNTSTKIEVEGHSTSCLPHIIGVTIKGIEGQYTMLECNRRGIAISTGSACQVGKQEPSKTMLAIGKTYEEAKQYVRFSDNKQRKIKLILLFMHYTQLEINFIEVLNHNETK